MSTFERGPERIEIALVDRTVVTRTYRSGMLVDESLETSSSALKGKWDADRRGRDLVDLGYTRIGGDEAAPSQSDLVAALEANPDDLDTYVVYADWLSERGEPWGQVMAVQHALAVLPRDKAARTRRAELEREDARLQFQHAAKLWGWLGEMIVDAATQTYASDLVGAVWHCGFVQSIRINARAVLIGDHGEVDAASIAAGYARMFRQLAKLDTMRLLRTISFSTYEAIAVALDGLVAERWPHVRELAIETNYVPRDALAVDAARLAPCLDGSIMPKLVDLMVLASHNTDALCHAIATSPIAAQLRSIKLYRGSFTEAGIGALARARFGALERLALSGVGPASAAMTLRSVAPKVVVEFGEMPPDGYDD